jgi:triacylglycerol lipase
MPSIGKQTLRRLAGLDAFPQPPVIRTRYPVVLMHGFGLLASLRRGGHLHEEALYLRSRGVMAYAPNVSPYHTIPFRSAMWKDRILRILSETGADAVTLVAHSMGGLDARYLVHEMGLHDTVAALVTVATPHHGSSLADVVLEQPERVREWMTDAARWVSNAAMQGTPADFRRAVADLTPEYVTGTFNPAVPDHPSVRYWSWSARAGRGTDTPINPLLRPLNAMLYAREGPNDGFVSVESAIWGEHLGTLEADHAQQIGVGKSIGSRFDASRFYAEVAERLGREGF